MRVSFSRFSLTLIFGCGFIIRGFQPVIAAPPQAAFPTTEPRTSPARPQMPASFNRETVQTLIRDIDKPHSASILKVGYFLRRGEPELPTSEGYALLKTASETEPAGTRKWFLLQNLRAFTSFRVAEVDVSEGFVAYNLMFARAADAARTNAVYPLRQAIMEFVASVPGKFKDLGLSKDERTRETLFKAWTAYAVALSAPTTAVKGRVNESDWKAAIETSGASEAFVPYVEKILADTSVPKTFGLLSAAASVLAPKNPDKALTLLQQAKPLLPKANGKPEINQAARLYDAVVELLLSRNRLAEAVSTQQEFVQLTGRGVARLMLLHHKSGNPADVQRLLTALSELTANEQEINKAALGLLELARDTKAPDGKAGEQASTLLKTYLEVKRTRDVEEELQARLTLAGFYLRQRKFDEAKTVLTFVPPQKPSPRARGLLLSAGRMNKQLAQAKERSANRETKENTP
jgi:tetratricopeptide (TPR) repeat protein